MINSPILKIRWSAAGFILLCVAVAFSALHAPAASAFNLRALAVLHNISGTTPWAIACTQWPFGITEPERAAAMHRLLGQAAMLTGSGDPYCHFQYATALLPEDVIPIRQLGKMAEAAGDLSAALAYFQVSNDGMSILRRGQQLIQSSRVREAIEWLTVAAQRAQAPRDIAVATYWLGRAYRADGDSARARQVLADAVRYATVNIPESEMVELGLLELSQLAAADGDKVGAADYARAAHQAAPQSTRPLLQQAQLALDQGDARSARQFALSALALGESASAHYVAAQSSRALGDPCGSAQHIAAAILLDPDTVRYEQFRVNLHANFKDALERCATQETQRNENDDADQP